MSFAIISVENLGKKYKIHHQAERRRDQVAEPLAAMAQETGVTL